MYVMSDLGFTRSANCDYRQLHNAVFTRGRRITEAILHTFATRVPKMLWPAFIIYVKPIIMYGAIVLEVLSGKEKEIN